MVTAMEKITVETACVSVKEQNRSLSETGSHSKPHAKQLLPTTPAHITSVLETRSLSKKHNMKLWSAYRDSNHQPLPVRKKGNSERSGRKRSYRKAAVPGNRRETKLQKLTAQSIENGDLVNAREVVDKED